MKFTSFVLVCLLAMTSFHADAARRMGGGKSFGQQSNNVSQREATRPAAPNAAPNATPGTAGAPPAAAAPRRPWAGMLGGLAAGLGLAWLAHSMGLGAEFGQFLMFGLLALVIMMVVGYFMRRRQAQSAPSPFAFEGAGAPAQPQSPPQYNPRNVGTDASARPWEGQTASFEPATPARQGLSIGSGVAGSATTWGIPAGFDVEGFVAAAKQNFVHLQDAWDRSDIPALKAMMTDTMLDEIKVQLAEREALAPGQVNKTEVVSLQAQLLGIEELENDFLASVEFTGLIREDPSAGPSPFREIWNMGRPKQGQMGWLVAGVQALQ